MTYDAVVVGAGPAGSAAATVLAEAGCSVLLLEKDRFPRAKVCGEFLSAHARPALERLRVMGEIQSLAPERIERGSVHLPRGAPVPFRLPAPAIGISRLQLDHLLARRAAQAGAQARFGARVLAIGRKASPGFAIRVSRENREEEVRARVAIGAWGRWDALDRALSRGFLRGRARFFGWSRDYGGETGALEGMVRLYLFSGGYCGLSRVEGGAVNLAGVVSERVRRGLGAGWAAVLDHARRSNAQLDRDLSALEPGPTGFLGTGPVFFTAKPPAEEGILLAGDAAGVIDPFSGEGQAAALASGILAGETALRLLSGEFDAAQSISSYERAWRARFGKRFAWSAALRSLMLHPWLAVAASRLAGRSLARFAIEVMRE